MNSKYVGRVKHLTKYLLGEAEEQKSPYQQFFDKALEKFGVSDPSELDDEKKKDFFRYVDDNWKGDEEVAETSYDLKEGDVKSVLQKARMSGIPDRKYLEDRFVAWYGPRSGHNRMSDKELAQKIAVYESRSTDKKVAESQDYDDEQGDVPGEQDTGPDEYTEACDDKEIREMIRQEIASVFGKTRRY